MKITYYPWNVQELVDWLKFEISMGKTLQELAGILHISLSILLAWIKSPLPLIKLEHILSIARYHGWKFDEAVQWLGIKAEHLEELRDDFKVQYLPGSEVDVFNEETLLETGIHERNIFLKEPEWEKTLRNRWIIDKTQSLQPISYELISKRLIY